jgi:hypothetical protein
MEWFEAHKENPYPSAAQKRLFEQQTSLTYQQICNWFVNTRIRKWKCLGPSSKNGPDQRKNGKMARPSSNKGKGSSRSKKGSSTKRGKNTANFNADLPKRFEDVTMTTVKSLGVYNTRATTNERSEPQDLNSAIFGKPLGKNGDHTFEDSTGPSFNVSPYPSPEPSPASSPNIKNLHHAELEVAKLMVHSSQNVISPSGPVSAVGATVIPIHEERSSRKRKGARRSSGSPRKKVKQENDESSDVVLLLNLNSPRTMGMSKKSSK